MSRARKFEIAFWIFSILTSLCWLIRPSFDLLDYVALLCFAGSAYWLGTATEEHYWSHEK